MNTSTLRTLLITPALVASLACATEEPTNLGSVHVKSGLISAAAGGQVEVTASDDYAPFVGAKVVVPAGALAQDTKITIDVYGASLMDEDADAVGPAVEFGPSGTTFDAPVQVTLPLTEDLDQDLARIYVRHGDGTREVLLPADLTVDAATKMVHFTVRHFTTYHPGRARGACRHVTCASGQTCRGGQCQNSGACTQAECSPAPGAPNYTCPDGSTAGPVCERDPAGTCGWNFVTCPGICQADADCAQGEQCINGTCAAGPTSCGGSTCGAGQYCCNPSCGICAPLGGSCTQQVCASACSSDADCASSESCVNGQCVSGQPCGNNVCPAGELCCNASCGMCAPPGVACTQQACAQCASDADCRNPAGGQGQCVNGYCQ